MVADNEEETGQPDALVHTAPSFAGMWRYLKGRLGRPIPPHDDPTKLPVKFQPYFRVVVWDGEATDHRIDSCVSLICSNPDGYGEHSEVRPNGFYWESVYFHGLHDALENQSFRRWYDDGGEKILESGKIVLRESLYQKGKSPPLPNFNFFLHENIEKMTAQEIDAYRRVGEVPKHLRRRGRNKSKPEVG